MPTIISPTNSKISFATKPQVLANNIDFIAIRVRVKDTNNQPVPSRLVEIVSDSPDVVIEQPDPTDSTGTAIGRVKSKTVGPVVLRARVLRDRVDTVADVTNGAVWMENTVTAYFYAREIETKPQLQVSARNIHLTWSVSRYQTNAIDGVRVRIEADEANLMPTKIFAYQLLPIAPGATEPVGAFDHICSSVDLEEYPEDEPDINSRPQWFRLNYVDVLLRSREEVREFIKSVVEDVKILRDTLDITEDLEPAGDLWLGTPPTGD